MISNSEIRWSESKIYQWKWKQGMRLDKRLLLVSYNMKELHKTEITHMYALA